jgi:hypothetical protein
MDRIALSSLVLSASLEDIQLSTLTIGEASMDLALQRHPQDVGVNVMRREGDIDIMIVK